MSGAVSGIEGKVVVVTGAASGLGFADARLLASQGAHVVMTDIDVERGSALAKEIGAIFLVHDVADEGRWGQVMLDVQAKYGRLDGLVNNAGVAHIANIENTSLEVWRNTMAVHLDGTFFGCQAAIKLMKASGGGSIVNMSSTAALIGIPDYLAYSAAKGGIRSMTTPMVHHALKELVDVDLGAMEDQEKARLSMGIGEPDDVAHMVAYLLSDVSKHVNGTEMVVDNGDTVV
jgi:3(or 17)beta-hydroxysteroid dehydrogenase